MKSKWMTKGIVLLLLFALISGCSSKNTAIKTTQTTADINKEHASTNYVKSPDGKHAIAESDKQYHILLYKDINDQNPRSIEIVGVNYGFLWSPDSSRACVSYSGRIWSDFSIINVGSESEIEKASIDSIIKQLRKDGVEINYELNENRPDPYLTPVEWSPDSKCILVFYQWVDKEYKVQNGVFVYDVETMRASRMVQYPPAEADHLQVRIPEGFKW